MVSAPGPVEHLPPRLSVAVQEERIASLLALVHTWVQNPAEPDDLSPLEENRKALDFQAGGTGSDYLQRDPCLSVNIHHLRGFQGLRCI